MFPLADWDIKEEIRLVDFDPLAGIRTETSILSRHIQTLFHFRLVV